MPGGSVCTGTNFAISSHLEASPEDVKLVFEADYIRCTREHARRLPRFRGDDGWLHRLLPGTRGGL